MSNDYLFYLNVVTQLSHLNFLSMTALRLLQISTETIPIRIRTLPINMRVAVTVLLLTVSAVTPAAARQRLKLNRNNSKTFKTSSPSFSKLPSFQPSMNPSTQPSVSQLPSFLPSMNPSAQASDNPTIFVGKSLKSKSSKVPSSEPSLFPSSLLGGRSVARFEVVLGLEGDIDVSSIDLSDAAAMFEDVIADLLPPPGSLGAGSRSSVVTQRIGDETLPFTLRKRQLRTGIDALLNVWISKLCSPEEACEDSENDLLALANTIADYIESQSATILRSIQSMIGADPVTGLNSISSVTSTASDPEVTTTLRSGEPSSEPSMEPSKSSQPSGSPSVAPSKSSQPSGLPSMPPSKSSQPSGLPSLAPSKSSQPSDTPSLEPSKSSQPSGSP